MDLIQIILISIGGLIIYFLPSLIGRNKKSSQGILILNFLLGWTVLGWIGALIWAVTSEKGGWIYTCSKCGYKTEIGQRITQYSCPQCKTITEYK